MKKESLLFVLACFAIGFVLAILIVGLTLSAAEKGFYRGIILEIIVPISIGTPLAMIFMWAIHQIKR